MNKKTIVLLLSIVLELLIVLGFINSKNNTYNEINGIRYAILVDGATASTFPTGNYKASVSCTNATGYWDAQKQKIIVENITGTPTCNISFTSITNDDYLNNYIMNLCNNTGTMATCSAATASSQGTGELVYENGIRYEGKDPNNYVWFNNELWQIIGVFDETSHGRNGEKLVKLIRFDSLGIYAWNGVSGYPNDWPNSTLYRMLNGCYLYQKKGNETINLTGQSGLCSSYSIVYLHFDDAFIGNDDFSKKGIDSSYRNMIADATWYLGGAGRYTYDSYDVDSVYGYERDATAVYNGNQASTTGKIGLIYVSDYGYSVLNSSCSRISYRLNRYDMPFCGAQSWIYGKGFEWTISPSPEFSTSVTHLSYYGDVYNGAGYSSGEGFAVRPVLYLSESVYRVSGDGSLEHPYIIGMATS